MPAKSIAQRKAVAIAEHAPNKLYNKNRGLLSMTQGQLHDFAATSEKSLPSKAKKKGGFRI